MSGVMSGGRPPDVSDKEILRVFVEDSDPVLSTREVSNEIGLQLQGTSQRLVDLKERDFLGGKKIGPSNAWWITDKGHAYLDGELDASEEGSSDES